MTLCVCVCLEALAYGTSMATRILVFVFQAGYLCSDVAPWAMILHDDAEDDEDDGECAHGKI